MHVSKLYFWKLWTSRNGFLGLQKIKLLKQKKTYMNNVAYLFWILDSSN